MHRKFAPGTPGGTGTCLAILSPYPVTSRLRNKEIQYFGGLIFSRNFGFEGDSPIFIHELTVTVLYLVIDFCIPYVADTDLD